MEMLQTAVEAAQQAGQVILKNYLTRHDITFKGHRDIVTEADTAAQAVVINLIRERFPDHAIISEEGENDVVSGKTGDYTWVVDPLDGTTNYSRRVPVFSVSIGLLKGGEPLVGVVHDPLRDQTFVAEQGKGAMVDGEPMRASRVERFDHTVVGLDWTRNNAGREQMLDCLREVAPRCGTIRVLGSAALALTFVAAGWLDVYFHLSLQPWDAAAAMLLIAEAGGRCTTLTGEPYHVDSPGCVATNGLVHEEMLGLLRTALK
jgi:myo-inositol-1(or 4)-monophosphatase